MLLKKSYFLALSISLAAAIAVSYICKSSEMTMQVEDKTASVEVQMQYEVNEYVLELALSHYADNCMLDDVNNIRIHLGIGKTNYQALGCASEGVKDSSLDSREVPMNDMNEVNL